MNEEPPIEKTCSGQALGAPVPHGAVALDAGEVSSVDAFGRDVSEAGEDAADTTCAVEVSVAVGAGSAGVVLSLSSQP